MDRDPTFAEAQAAIAELGDSWWLRQRLIEESPLLFLTTAHQVFDQVNPALTEALGYSVLGWPVARWMSDVLHPDDIGPTVEWFNKALELGTGAEVRYVFSNRIRRHRGGWIRVWWYSYVNVETQRGCSLGFPEPLMRA